MSSRIAIVGIACRYPDAATHKELWENVLAGRRAFRRIPEERMRLDDYWSADKTAPDRFYARHAAVIEGYEFDRVAYKIAGSTFRTTDMTHWLALDTAARALEDAGFPGGEGLPRERTAAIVGNSLTGEFTRANLMRLRWPYVRRLLGSALSELGWEDDKLTVFLTNMEARYKDAFPPVDEDTLAGGLANTIAGRICNHFDFNGGGFTVDGACSSSLLSVGVACSALASGQLDAALAGGVDLSIDPFEIIGFAKTGALATDEMKVYDRDSNGFWPGEGCGMLALMREQDAKDKNLRIYATIAGWGYSSDGKGGMTRPEAAGHRLAITRAYEIAGFGFDTVGYLEGHGTGTAVGDATELRAISEARRAAGGTGMAAISTVKGNIGHTKAAAGVAGLIKATMAVHHQVIPPATGHLQPHQELGGDDPALRVPLSAEQWPQGQPVRAGVSAMGFGGINAHVVLDSADGERRRRLDDRTLRIVASRQDHELLLLDASGAAELRGKAAKLAELAPRLSFAELSDLAATLNSELDGRPIRAAVVARRPEDTERAFSKLLALLDEGTLEAVDVAKGVFLGGGVTAPRIGYLFPGQGSGKHNDGGALGRRFESVSDLYQRFPPTSGGDSVATAVAQPRIVTSSIAGLRVLSELGIEATAATGHSLGELTALHWAGAMDEQTVIGLAAERGRVMAEASDGDGAMASIAAGPEAVRPLLRDEPVVIAGYNGPGQTVVSGPATAVERVCERAVERGLAATKIAVSHAFHSPAVAPATTGLAAHLAGITLTPLARGVVSTVTGQTLASDADLRELLVTQVTEPVRFTEAVTELAAHSDLLIEVGPGRVLSGLAGGIADVPVVTLDTDGPSLAGTLTAIAAAFVLGAPVRHDRLFAGRFVRPLPLDKEFRFFASPCESAPADDPRLDTAPAVAAGKHGETSPRSFGESKGSTINILRRLAAERAELPLDAVSADSHPLDELHLSSITVGQIMNTAARELGVTAPVVASGYATAKLADLAAVLDELAATQLPGDVEAERQPAGIEPWVRAFTVELTASVPGPRTEETEGQWRVFAPEGHPLAGPLRDALTAAKTGDGVLLCLPPECGEHHVRLMLQAARAALAHDGPCRFVAVQDERGAAGLAKTLHLEKPSVPVTVVSLPISSRISAEGAEQIAARIAEDVAATTDFSEIMYDADGGRAVPLLRPVTELADSPPPLGPDDVLLVTGGGKGITAECALALGKDSGAAVALLGRSDPGTDAELTANIARFEDAGVMCRYVRADVTSPEQVSAAIKEIGVELGSVTAVLHGAGRNEPSPLDSLTEDAFARTLAPKVRGLEAVLSATDPASLKLLITFGSIIGRAGLRGQADYAVANDWLTELTKRTGQTHPGCRCVALEWSVWSGAGMGERLGVLESLIREGISPISVEDGIAVLRQVLANPELPTALVVMGRAGGLPTLALEPRELPLTRFTDNPRVNYPGIELVADAELSASSDQYLADHLLDGDLLFPAVLGMEAMTQAAVALDGSGQLPVLEDVEFLRPIVVPPDGSITIRIAALIKGTTVQAAIRSSETGFQADHFRAALRFGAAGAIEDTERRPALPQTRPVPLDPGRDLYGGIFFQGPRFHRVLGYRWLAATSCVAEISSHTEDTWFGTFLPQELVLGDPGSRDAFMHAIQCCVPNATLLPQGIKRLRVTAPRHGAQQVVLRARELLRDGDTYVYDLDVRDDSGRLVERWEGLRLRAVRKTGGAGPWVPALLGPFIERQVAELLIDPPRCAVEPDPEPVAVGVAARRDRTNGAVSRLLGSDTVVKHRGDGMPEVATDGVSVSSSHNAGVTFAVSGSGRVACDVEPVRDRDADEWKALLGSDLFALAELLVRERGEALSIAATRAWGAAECLRKTGRAVTGPVTAAGPRTDGWVLLEAGSARIATFVTQLRDEEDPSVFTILTEGGS